MSDEDQPVPEDFFFLKSSKQKAQQYTPVWDKAMQTLLFCLTIQNYNREIQERSLDLLIYLTRENQSLKQQVIEQGSLRILLTKCGAIDSSVEISKRCLVIIRDLCQGNWMTTDLMSRYETEKHLMRVMQKSRTDTEICEYISQVLELMIKGYDLDQENLEKNMKVTQERLTKYVNQKNDECDAQKVLQHVDVLRFYSLMACYVPKIVSYQFDELLVALLEKEHSFSFDRMDQFGFDTDHLKVLMTTNLIIEKITLHSDVYSIEKGSKDAQVKLSKLIMCINMGLQKLIKFIKQQRLPTGTATVYSDCIVSYMNLLQTLMINENTKVMGCEIIKQCQMGNTLLELKEMWDSNASLNKIANNLIFIHAKISNDEANKIVKKLVIKDIFNDLNQQQQPPAKQQPQQQPFNINQQQPQVFGQPRDTASVAQNRSKSPFSKASRFDFFEEEVEEPEVPAVDQVYEKKKRNLEFIARLSDIPEAAKEIMGNTEGLARIFEVLNMENKQLVATFPEFGDDQVDEKIYMLNYGQERKKVPDDQVQLLIKTIEILRKLLRTPEFRKKIVTENVIRDLVSSVRTLSTHRDYTILALRVLNEISGDEEFQGVIQDLKGVESIFFPLNEFPTDNDIIELTGNILKQLGAEEIAKSVKVQYDDLKRNFNVADTDSLDAIRQANIYLANLMTSAPDEETEEIIKDNKKVVAALQIFFAKDLPDDFLAALLLMVSRLCNQGEETKRILRNSDIPIKIVNNVFMEVQKKHLMEFALDAELSMIGGGADTLHLLDADTGEDVEQETDEIRNEYLAPMQGVFLKYQMKPVEKLVSSIQKYEKASKLLGVLCKNDKQQFFPLLKQFKTHEVVLKVFKDLGEHHSALDVKASAFQKCGFLLAELAKNDAEIFIQVCVEDSVIQSMLEILEKTRVDDAFANTLSLMENVSSVLKFMEEFLSTPFDKSILSKQKVPQLYSGFIRGLLEYFAKNLQSAQENAFLCILLRDSLNVFWLLLKDPLLVREIPKTCYIQPIMELIQVTLKSGKIVPPEDSDEIYGSAESFSRILERVYRVLLQAMSDIKTAIYFNSLFQEDESLAKVAFNNYNNPYLITKCLMILKKASLALQEPIQNKMLYLKKNLKLYQQKSVQQYPKIPFIAKCFDELQSVVLHEDLNKKIRDFEFQLMTNVKEVEQFATALKGELHQPPQNYVATEQSVVKDEVENIQQRKKRAAEGDFNQETIKAITSNEENLGEIIKHLDKMANALDRFFQMALDLTNIPANQRNKQDLNWIEALLKLIQAIQEYVNDQQSASKIHHIEITNSLLSLLMLDDSLDPRINVATINCLEQIFKFGESLKIYEKKIQIYDPYKTYIQYLLQLKNPSTSPCIKPFFSIMKQAVCMEEINQKLIKQNQVIYLARLMNKINGNVPALTTGAECLDRYGFTEKIAQAYYEEGIANLILQQFAPNLKDSTFTSAFCLLIGTLCRYQPAQSLLSQNKLYQTVIQGMNVDMKNIKLLANSFYAISGLCYNNKAFSHEILESGITKTISNLLGQYQQEAVLVETICSVISNLTFKNDNNKKILGEQGVIELLVQAFKYYSIDHQTLRSKTLKQILRLLISLGNTCFLLENTNRLVQTNFIQLSLNFVEKKLAYAEMGEILKYTLDVYSNVCSHPEETNRANVEAIIKLNFVENVLQILKKNILISDIVLSGMDTLDGLVQSKIVSMLISEKGGIEIILRITKSHDWNDMVVNKCFRLLANIAIMKQNAEYFIKNQVPQAVADILKNLKTINQKLIVYAYKILHRIAGDKTKEKILHKCGFVEAISEILSKRGFFENNVEMVQLLNKIALNDESLDLIARKCGNALQAKISEPPKEQTQADNLLKESIIH